MKTGELYASRGRIVQVQWIGANGVEYETLLGPVDQWWQLSKADFRKKYPCKITMAKVRKMMDE